jgi:hypothetical protein
MKFAQMARIAAKASVVAGLDWLVWYVAIMHDGTIARGCRSAELYEHNLDPTCTLNSTNVYISSLQELLADSLRFYLNNTPSLQ